MAPTKKRLRRATLVVICLALALALSSYERSSMRGLIIYPNATIAAKSPRLEFFHIPKTGGTMLEELAGKNNVTWGACHFYTIPLRSKNERWITWKPWPSCPAAVARENDEFPRFPPNLWHTPLYMLHYWLKVDPYDIGVVNQTMLSRPKRFFSVVRNPYDRLISLYYYQAGKVTVHNESTLNDFVFTRIKESCEHVPQCIRMKKHCNALFWCAPQHLYVYNNLQQTPSSSSSSRVVIDDILKYETLAQDFNALSARYELNFTMSEEKHQKRKRILSAENFTDEALIFINYVFRKDFDYFGYDMIQPSIGSLD